MKRVLITGAAGNLGGFLADYLKDSPLELNLMIHKKGIPPALERRKNVKVFKADLKDKESLSDCMRGVDVAVHFAGVLFSHNPEKFLPVTNVLYFKNLLEKCVENKVKRVILISFPHVEGETTPENPARGILNGAPESVHARTRLEEERLLFEFGAKYGFEPVVLRVGMVYGRGILMIDAARRFARWRLLGIWSKPTWIHLISVADFLEAAKHAVLNEGVSGIYHLGDEGVQTLQEFLNDATAHWNLSAPWKMRDWQIFAAARIFEVASFLFGVKSPLTSDFVKIGMASYYGDTARMRRELLPELKYRTYKDGIGTL